MTEQYLRVYPLYSWFVHSGPIGFMNFDEKTMEMLFYFAHCDAHRIFLDSTKIIAEHLKISKTITSFNEALKNLEALPKRLAIEEGLKRITESIKEA